MTYQTTYVKGDSNKVCDVCGFQYKGSQLRKRWDGLLVCSADWEPRHPQDFVRAVPDRQAVKEPRPDPTPNFISPGEATAEDL